MGRGGDEATSVVKRSLGDLEEKTKKGMEKDLPTYVNSTDFRPGFTVSFAHEARAGKNFETPKLSQAALKRPALLLSFRVDREVFVKQEGIEDLSGDNQEKLLAVYLSNRLLPLAEIASGGRVVQGQAAEDSDGLDSKVSLQNISFADGGRDITYSVALS